MKLKMTLAAAAVGLAFAAPASAIVLPSTGNGELFVSVWDSNVGGTQGYARGLGVTLNDFLANPNQNLTFAADPLFQSNFSPALVAGGTLRWTLFAGDSIDTVGNRQRVLTTGQLVAPNNLVAAWNHAALNAALVNANIDVLPHLNSVGCGVNASCVSNDPGIVGWPGGIDWADDFGANNVVNAAGNIGSALNFFLVQNAATGATTSTLSQTQRSVFLQDGTGPRSTWSLAADGSVNYVGTAGVQVDPIPVPAAVWLLGSGLLGLVGVARRRQTKAA
jgi:hypothetical protein